MSPLKKGTKLTDNPKDTMLRVRMDAETVNQLDECVGALNSNRSEVVRQGVKELHERVKTQKK